MVRDRKDVLWITIAATLILAFGSVPTWSGRAAQTDELRFRGLYFDEQDYAVHLAMMQSGLQGDWAYQLRFTTEPHSAVYIRLFYIVLGHLSGLLQLAPETTFTLARWLLGYAALFAAYALFRRIFPEAFWARTAFLLAAVGSGLGWLQLMTGWISGEYPPVDFWLIDAYVLFSLSIFPHFAFVTAGMCLALSLWLDFLNDPDWRLVGFILLIAVLVQLANPIAFALVDAGFAGAALFAWWGQGRVRARDLAALGIIAAGQLPLLIYNLAVLSRDPVWSQFTAQNQTPSPSPDYYLWSFGLFWPFAVVGAWFAVRARNPALGAALAWAAAAFALAYAPFNIQRRFLQGVTIPLAVLAGWALMRLFEARATLSPRLRRWRGALASAFILIASISTIFFIAGQTIYMRSRPAKYFYPASLEDAASWLGQHAAPGAFALAAEPTGSLLAQRSGLKVYLGHPMETLDYPVKQINVDAYFEGRLPPEWLGATPISLVIYGPYEREIAPDFVPGPDLEVVYRNADVVIYTVK